MLPFTLFTSLVFALLAVGSHSFHQNPSDILSIQHTIAQYPLSIDLKDFSHLSTVFTNDAVANYGIAGGVFHGLSDIEIKLSGLLVNFTTQHSLTTQSINVLSKHNAEADTYVIATQFGKASTSTEGTMVVAYARFQDKLRFTNGVWKIYDRLVVFMVHPIQFFKFERQLIRFCQGPFIRSSL